MLSISDEALDWMDSIELWIASEDALADALELASEVIDSEIEEATLEAEPATSLITDVAASTGPVVVSSWARTRAGRTARKYLNCILTVFVGCV